MNPDLIETDDTVTLSRRRCKIAIEAACEIDKLAEVVAGLVPLGDDQIFFAVRGIAARLRQLATISMGVLSDEAEDTEHLARQLRIEGESEAVIGKGIAPQRDQQ